MMDRLWFLTNTCYGQWLPGDDRGFVGFVVNYQDPQESKTNHSLPGNPYLSKIRGLELAAKAQADGPPIELTRNQADTLLAQFQETASFRKWTLLAASIMFNHFHIVVGVPGDPEPSKILGDFKSYGTRSLSKTYGVPASQTWWTQQGSKRKVKDQAGLFRVCKYVVEEQPNPLAVFSLASVTASA